MEKIIAKIRKLLEMTQENGASENEAMIAALKAQKLMAEYNLEITDVEGELDSKEMINAEVDCKNGDKWKYRLASIIARNFCCKVSFMNKRYAVFFGYKQHAEVAQQVFKFLFENGNKFADRIYYDYYKKGMPTRGVKNTYLVGFCQGIEDVLAKQCTALMLVVPKEVEEKFSEKMKDSKIIHSRLSIAQDRRAYDRGVNEGRSLANARSIEG